MEESILERIENCIIDIFQSMNGIDFRCLPYGDSIPDLMIDRPGDGFIRMEILPKYHLIKVKQNINNNNLFRRIKSEILTITNKIDNKYYKCVENGERAKRVYVFYGLFGKETGDECVFYIKLSSDVITQDYLEQYDTNRLVFL